MKKEDFDKLSDTSRDLIISTMKHNKSELLEEVNSFDDIMRKWNEIEQALEIEEDLEMLTGQTNNVSATHRAAVRNFHRNFSDAWFWMVRA